MAFIPFDRCIDTFFDFTGPDAEPCGWSLTFRCNTTVGVSDLFDLGQGCASWFDTDMQPLMTPGYTLTQIRMRDLTAENSFVYDWVGILPLTGTLAGNSLPSNSAWALKKQTGLAGRSYRGRIYHMGLGEEVVSGNYIDGTYAANVLDAWNALLSQLDETGNGFTMVVPSRYENGVERTTGVATPVLAIVATDLIVDTQRRRLPRA